MTINKIILATKNRGKITELADLLYPIQCIPMGSYDIPEVEETGQSFIENAIIKARHTSRYTLEPALADDSGLVVKALNGQPGIYSARFAGTKASDAENMDRLLDLLKNTPDNDREAYFYCAIAIVNNADDPTPLIATGSLHGKITHEREGTQGFGYDPIFYLPEAKCTLANLSPSEKNKISHRANALRQLRNYLKL